MKIYTIANSAGHNFEVKAECLAQAYQDLRTRLGDWSGRMALVQINVCGKSFLNGGETHQDGDLSSPEIVEMHMDGTLCEQCGGYLGRAVGHSRLCVGCGD